MKEIVVVNKPAGLTSRDVVNKLNHIFNTKKIGHTGTLDPLATGVLVCLVGSYTKLVDEITSLNKEYVAEIKLGIKTDTGDVTGNILESSDVKVMDSKVKEVFESFPKKYMQSVPAYSAVKINGKKLYEYARSGQRIDLPKREVNIFELELLNINDDIIKFRALVSKGTYIRSLIEDICESIGTIGTMNSLIRTKQGSFSLSDSYNLESIESGKYTGLSIMNVLDYPVIEIPQKYIKVITNGGKIENLFNVRDKVIFTINDEEIAIYKLEENVLRPYIMF